MMVAVAAKFIENISEQLSPVWIELVLGALAALAYYFTSYNRKVANVSPKQARSPRIAVDPEPAGPSAAQLAFQALEHGRLQESIRFIQQMPTFHNGKVPNTLAIRLLTVAMQMRNAKDMSTALKPIKGKVKANPMEVVLAEAVQSKNVIGCRRLHMITNQLLIPTRPAMLEGFAQAYSSDVGALRSLTDEAATPVTMQFAKIVLEACITLGEPDLAKEIVRKVSPYDAVMLDGLIERATDFTECKGSRTCPTASANTICSRSTTDSSTGSNSDVNSPRDSSSDDGAHKNVPLISKTSLSSALGAAPKDIAQRANDIRSCGRNGDLRGAIKVFSRLGEQANHTLILNSLADACVECKNLEHAIEYFDRSRSLGLADVFMYNTIIKGYLARGQEAMARQLLEEILEKGMEPTRASYHGLLNARVNANDFKGAWKLVAHMQTNGLSPNAVTCSIMLKNRQTPPGEVSRVLVLIDAMVEPMDEVLFLSIVEACIRTGRLDSLSRQVDKFMSLNASTSLAAPTYGSMIKAFGHARDVQRVWRIWNQMASHGVLPTSVTLGCMVEALVHNGCTQDAWKLTRNLWNDDSTRTLVNSVIYSTILKGFANMQNTEKVMVVYEDMKSHGIPPTTITFNTILNAFANGGAMHRVPALLEDMAAAQPPVELDIISYSTIVKGYCNSGNLDRGLKVLEDMRARGKHAPDEVMYNSLLGGCAKEHRPDQALELLNDMRKFGVAPSNYTLSMLVKLMGKCRRIKQAFAILENISKEYGLKINIQVYTCLIQGCFNEGLCDDAIALHEKVIQEGLWPDAMTYTVLVRGCAQAGNMERAVYFAKCACGKIPGLPASKESPPGLNSGCLDELRGTLGEGGTAEAKELLSELANCCSGGQQSQRGAGTSGAASWRHQRM